VKEKEIKKLMKDAELAIESDALKEAGEKIHQAIQIAKNIGNAELLNKIFEFLSWGRCLLSSSRSTYC
jgi:hypothetical protein